MFTRDGWREAWRIIVRLSRFKCQTFINPPWTERRVKRRLFQRYKIEREALTRGETLIKLSLGIYFLLLAGKQRRNCGSEARDCSDGTHLETRLLVGRTPEEVI